MRRFATGSLVAGCALTLGLAAYSTTGRAALGRDEQHNPRIHKALDALHDAHDELEEARHDFHGEKRAAMDAVDQAIAKLDHIKDW